MSVVWQYADGATSWQSKGRIPVSETAKRIEKRREIYRPSGLESFCDFVAAIMLISGLVVSLFYLVGSALNGSVLRGLLGAVICGLYACVSWLLFRCLAEHLRLQKAIAGLPYAGRISGGDDEVAVVWGCSNCGAMLHSQTHCDACGAKIEIEGD